MGRFVFCSVFLFYSSCHPRYIDTNIPYCLTRRMKTIVSENSQLLNRMDELKQDLIKSQFQIKLIQDGKDKAMENDTRQVKDKKRQNKIIPFASEIQVLVLQKLRHTLCP